MVVVAEPLRDLPGIKYDEAAEDEGAEQAVDAARQRREEQREQAPEYQEPQARHETSLHK